MLTDKQIFFFQIIEEYYKKYNVLPNLNTIKKITNYKSYNSIYKYLSILEKNNLLKYDSNKKEIIYLKVSNQNNNIMKIPYLDQNNYYYIESNILNNNKNYYIYKIKDNDLKKNGIIKNDLVIIEKNNKKVDNKLVLIKYNDSYKLFKCEKKDDFIRLINDKKAIDYITNKDIIGFVIELIRSFI